MIARLLPDVKGGSVHLVLNERWLAVSIFSKKLSSRKGGTQMAAKKPATRASSTTGREPSKAELQRRMEAAREEISETVAEIKDTVTEQYESVKESVTETLDWRAQFRKHSVAFSLGALAVGFIVGNGIAASLEDATPKRGRKREGLLGEIYNLAENLSEEFSGIAQTILLPALIKKVKDKFGIDVADRLAGLMSTSHSTKRAVKRKPAKRASSKRTGAKKRTSSKKTAKKSSEK